MTESNDAGDGVGDELRRARDARGLTVADVAQQLKFAQRQIEALEHGRYAELPTGTFARGMVRAYARLLKLDPEPLVQRVAGRVAAPDNAQAVASVRRPIPITDSARRTNLIYAALSVTILVVVAGVVFEWQRERSGTARLTFVPAAQQAPAAKEPPQFASSAVSVAAVTVAPGGIAAPESAAAPATPEAAPVAPGPAAEGVHRIHLKYERDSWIEIRSRGEKLLASRLNAGGTEQTVEGRPPFSLIIGNAQYVRLTYDDKPVDLAPHVKVEVARFTLD
jgi:cytoskeleton protein RodZ